ncbi:MAG: hypothetical protein ACKPKO_48400, partial [Candidatus Fonsibacter sp.]
MGRVGFATPCAPEQKCFGRRFVRPAARLAIDCCFQTLRNTQLNLGIEGCAPSLEASRRCTSGTAIRDGGKACQVHQQGFRCV